MLVLHYSPHSESTDNELGRASGHADVALSDTGRAEADSLRQHYATDVFDAVYCSDLQRATTTAELVFGGRGVPIIADARLRECDYGVMTQMPKRVIDIEYLKRIREPFPKGESVQMVVERVGEWLRDVLRDYDGKRIVVVGHRATRYALEYWSGDKSLASIVGDPWAWRAVPIWRYTVEVGDLERRRFKF